MVEFSPLSANRKNPSSLLHQSSPFYLSFLTMASSHFPPLCLSEHNYVSDSYDRLSELPDSLILSILSFLCSTRDTVRTTILSKRWKDLWTTVPCLHFQDENPEFIYRVIAKWRGAKIQSFRLQHRRLSPMSDVDVKSWMLFAVEWLLFAVEKQVEDLHIFPRIPYCPPQSLYSCSSITSLLLDTCLFKIEGSVQLNQLETLSIMLPVSPWADAINKILLGAPRLENMLLRFIKIDGNLNILSRSLKTLDIDRAEIKGVITVSAPNLLTLKIHASIFDGARFLCHAPSLTEACFKEYFVADYPPVEPFYQLFKSICHVKKITLNIELKKEKKKDMVVQFPNAEVLIHESLRNRIGLLDVLDLLELFPKLKMLYFHGLDQGFEVFDPISAEMAFPSSSLIHLKRVDITCASHDPSLIPFIGSLLQNAPSLDEMVLHLRKCTRRNYREVLLMVEEKVRSMPRSSPTAKVIINGSLIN